MILLMFVYCAETPGGDSQEWRSEKLYRRRPANTIVLQPLADFPEEIYQSVASRIREIYAGAVVVKAPVSFPQSALNYTKTRYRADSLIRFLGHLAGPSERIIGLTREDISCTKGTHADWGIMGLGYCPGKSCIASSYRLKGRHLMDKLFKVALHELGHTEGLPHCPVRVCLMRDAEGKDHLDDEKAFCKKCKSFLIKRGWALR